MKRGGIFLELPFVCLYVAGILTVAAHTIPVLGTPAPKPTEALEDDTRSTEQIARLSISIFCGGCHQSGRSGLDFDEDALDVARMRRNPSDWEQVVTRLKRREMPPRKFPQPSEAERRAMITWIEQEVLQQAMPAGSARLMARRLQRSEYANTIRDLLGVSVDPTATLPKDEPDWLEYSDVPQVADALKDQYRAVAEKLIDQAIAAERDSEMDDDDDPAPAIRVAMFSCDCSQKTAAENAREILAGFVRRAYRGAVDPSVIDGLMSRFDQAERDGKSFDEGIKLALLDALTSPQFLYRTEARSTTRAVSAPQPDSFALASRLSYLLWRTTPDEELLNLAEQGQLVANLDAQVRRMLKHPQTRAFGEDFATGWLSLNKIDEAVEFDEPLRRAMRRESEHFVDVVLREDRSILEFLDADYTFVNERLAKHYGISGIRGDAMRKVPVREAGRGGLLGHAAVLSITSRGFQSSPINRGKWVLENLLGAPPIRPPAGLIEALQNSSAKSGPGTRREQIEHHRANPSCAQCHVKMDAIGLSLEAFGPDGIMRTHDGPWPIEDIGILEDGSTLKGAAGLRTYLLEHRELFVRGLGERLLRFALGRKLDDSDRASLQGLPQAVAKDGNRFSRVILEVVRSEAFLKGNSGTIAPADRVAP